MVSGSPLYLNMRVFMLFALIGVAFAAVSRSPKGTFQRIVGGSPTNVEEYPYMSNMQYLVWGISWAPACGGSLITTRTVLSAAHCYEGDLPSRWRVRLGSSIYFSGGTLHQVLQLILHEGYNSITYDNDVAIVRLDFPATLGESIAVAHIAGSTYWLPDDTTAYTVGWGTLSSGGSAPEQLQHVDINIINQEICRQRYATLSGWPVVTDGMICAGILDVGGKDACQGDSGGPLTHKAADGHVLVGIVSWGYGCADAFFPGVNARVSHFTNWIVANGSS